MDLAYRNARDGMTEWEMDHRLDVWFAERSMRHELTDIAFGPKGALFVGQTDNRLAPGNIFRLDLGGSYGGYWADMSRSSAVLGPPSEGSKRAHSAILAMNERLRLEVRPGVRPCDLYRLCMGMFEERGYSSLTPQAGHSLGRMVHEPPFLTPRYERPLEPSMIVVVEPTMRVQGEGSFNIEDTLLVTEDGVECLTTVPREIDAYL
jgi:Xaa-Pro aminopeptidase